MNICLIPARGGSKGVPGKNIKLISGKPLIAWSIEQALDSRCIDEVFVSTDCAEIKEVARQFGAKVPFMRPENISGDTATTESAVMHFITWASQHAVPINNLILIQATSPFRYPGQIDKAMQQFINEQADSMLTVTKTHSFIWKNPAQPKASYDIFNRPRRQDIKTEDQLFVENGSFYITKLSIYEKFQNRLGGKVSMFEMTSEESIEIDNLLDFNIAESFMQYMGLNR